jgi:hypothetical protein
VSLLAASEVWCLSTAKREDEASLP